MNLWILGCLEFDDEAATLEDAILKDTVEAYNRRMKEFEEHTKARSRQLAAFMGHHQVGLWPWSSLVVGDEESFLPKSQTSLDVPELELCTKISALKISNSLGR